MNALTKTDLQFVVSRIPKDVRALMEKRALFLAGGFIRATIAGESVSDLDLFGASKQDLESAAAHLALSRHGRMHITDNAFTVLTPGRLPVQFIHRWLFEQPSSQETAITIATSFDFTIAQSVVWFDSKWASACAEGFYPDLAARRLVYTAPLRNEDAGGSILRVRKFLAKGYHIQAPALGAVIARLIRSVDFANPNARTESGIAKILTGLLREVDPMIAIDGLDLVDEHESFDVESPNA